MKKTVAKVIPAVEKSCDLWMDDDRKVRSVEMELWFTKHRKKSFNEVMAAVNKNLSAARVNYAGLR